MTDELGTVFQHLEYFPSGEIWVDERSETQRTPYLFSGKELDEETGLSYFGYRYSDARQGQWISADPILDEMLDTGNLERGTLSAGPFHLPGNVYGYVGNSPTNLVDHNGLGKRSRAGSSAGTGGDSSGSSSGRPERKRARTELDRRDEIERGLGSSTYPIGGNSERAAGGEGNYDVSAKVYRGKKVVGRGKYSSATGVHAEINAVENALENRVPLGKISKILVTKGCCRRCAAVMERLGLADKVGPKETSPTYSGAYAIPTRVKDALESKLAGTGWNVDDFVEVVKSRTWW